jgi:hypothetical protein
VTEITVTGMSAGYGGCMYLRMTGLFAVTTLLLLLPLFPIQAEVGVSVEFSNDEIRVISAWYRERGLDEPQGSKRKGRGRSRGLPPGIAKNLHRGKPLPPGIAKQSLPSALVRELPPPEPGYERVIIDGRVVLVDVATQVIHDILSDAILR